MGSKVILVLVEGPTDRDALGLVFSRLAGEQAVVFDVLHTDLTAKEELTAKYIEERMEEEIRRYLNRNPFIRRQDIGKVVQLIDTDGAFVPADRVVQGQGETEYTEASIFAKDRDRMIRRNISKRGIVYRLCRRQKTAGGYPFEMYYFSRNLEHVLHGEEAPLSAGEKEELAFRTAETYAGNPEKFLEFLGKEEIRVPGTYGETWKFIMENGNSLGRHCNLLLFFEEIRKMHARR